MLYTTYSVRYTLRQHRQLVAWSVPHISDLSLLDVFLYVCCALDHAGQMLSAPLQGSPYSNNSSITTEPHNPHARMRNEAASWSNALTNALYDNNSDSRTSSNRTIPLPLEGESLPSRTLPGKLFDRLQQYGCILATLPWQNDTMVAINVPPCHL